VKHTHSDSGFKSNQLIERRHGTLEARTSAMRGLKSPASQISRGFAIDYNFLRPHLSRQGRTPAQTAEITLPFTDGCADLTAWATVYRTLCQVERRQSPTSG